MFSKACEYGIRASVFISQQSLKGKRVNLNEISYGIDSPTAFTAKILQQLSRNSIIQSIKGNSGGFEIQTSDMKTVKLSAIVSAIDGDQIYSGCGLGLKECDESKPCPLHDKFKDIRNDLKHMLEHTSLHDLALGLNNGLSFLKR